MTEQEYKLHQTMLRHARGLLAAWEAWLHMKTHEEDNADPVKVFAEVASKFSERRK